MCVSLSTEGESLNLAKTDHIKHLDCSPKWPVAKKTGSVAGGVVTCGRQKGESLARQTPTERDAGLLLKALLSHTFIRF